MPIKFPKGFTRRKSSGNALEEVENPPQPSFRVLERPSSEGRFFNDPGSLKKMANGHHDDEDNLFAGTERFTLNRTSGGTDHSAMHEGSSSTRFSSSSTLPSSTDMPLQDSSPHSRNFYDIPVPPLSSALRAAGRTFSFGGRLSKTSTPPPHPPPSARNETPITSRTRAMTSSTTSTATPPRLLDEDIGLGKMEDDGFGNMFDNVGKRESMGLPFRSSNRNPQEAARVSAPAEAELALRPTPIAVDRSRFVESALFSSGSRNSQDGLLSPTDSNRTESPAQPPRLPHSRSMPVEGRRAPLPTSNSMPLPTTSHRSLERPTADRGLRRSVVFADTRASASTEDEDARLVMQSLYSNRAPHPLVSGESEQSGAREEDTSLFGYRESTDLNSASTWASPSQPTPLRPTDPLASPSEAQLDAAMIADHARLAHRFEESQPRSDSPANKVMTPSQFEHYRHQQELRRSNSDASASDESSESEYEEEEDETEKNREAERQRRKQEAHLSIYRQQMMKVTGQQQQSPAPSLRPEMDRATNSTPTLTATPTMNNYMGNNNNNNNNNNKSGSGKSGSEGDEDEEIPLGILAAHGFPNRNRPPTRLASASSNPNLRSSLHPYLGSPGSAAASGELDPNNRNSLPVFARNLPRDPYFGASLVNPSNRESLALGGGLSSVAGGGPAPALPPGGLIGVIATEERARAMRRGSPNTQTTAFGHRGDLPGMASVPNGIPRPYTMMNVTNAPPGSPGPQQQQQQLGMSPAEQAQIQLSQQMSHMMQMQMQWMQQMMQGIPGGATPPPMPPHMMMMPNHPGPMPVHANNARPVSMMGSGAVPFDHQPSPPLAPPLGGGDPRMSMFDPRWGSQSSLVPPPPPGGGGGLRPGTPLGQGYAPSIAPSERSNIGLSSRYRPVSTIQLDATAANRSSTMISSSVSKPWNDENFKPSMSMTSLPRPSMPKSSSMTTVTVRPISSDGKSALGMKNGNMLSAADEDDDDEGWAEMMKKREKKKSSWKMKRATSSLGDLFNAVH
ncbi:hypothetical protein ASPZODRAFT_146555 [Penicilliopsis zonata CBS 506.65]|uniref:Uncharacterized protein n=1 Tax=Penicilliopsis zonata CBS 506.65 TaxID=1073090 RepID=A0A1L9S764_9EURO|nr:hypothetical protein ASPZODRAFT_146555 [Penicilliopsis zonata CBS 506.65]OJJ42994.1 hypothetical protein ASPZODRAFT_146555 [Penicilliopsis zonata CBS 506.65]